MLIYATNWMSRKGIMLSFKNPIKGHILYDSIYITFFKRQNYRDEKSGGCQG